MTSAAQQPRIAILACLEQELQPIVDLLELRKVVTSFYGERGGMMVFAMATGMGGARAAEWLNRVARDIHPQTVVCAGFAGALANDLKPGDIIRPEAVFNEAGEVWRLPSAPARPPERVDRAEVKGRPAILCTQRPAFTVEEKSRLSATFPGARAVDTESADVAERAATLNLPVIVLRAISDTVREAIPPRVADWVDGAGHCVKSVAATDLLSRPWLVPAVWRLQRRAKVAGRALAQEVATVLEAIRSQGTPEA